MSSQSQALVNEWPAERVAAYAEAGNMLRHYSSCRIAVVSTALPVFVGILGWVLSANQQGSFVFFLLVAEALLVLYAIALSFYFSAKYEETRKYLVKIESRNQPYLYGGIVSSGMPNEWGWDSINKGLIPILGASHAVFYVYFYFLLISKPTPVPVPTPTASLQDQAAVRSVVLGDPVICRNGESAKALPTIKSVRFPAPGIARVEVTCEPTARPGSSAAYLVEKQNDTWQITLSQRSPGSVEPDAKRKRKLTK